MESLDWYKLSFLFIIAYLHTQTITVGQSLEGKDTVNMAAIQSKLSSVFEVNDIPDGIVKVVGALESSLHLLNCLPIQKSDNCYHPNGYCEIDVNDFTLQAKLTICKNPWTLRIDFKLPQDLKKRIPGILRPLVFIDVEPIVLTLDNNKADGVTTIISNSKIATAGLNIFGFSINAAKAYFNFYLFVRWDCTKPSDNVKRLKYNIDYDDGKPGNDMNKLYYKLKIDYEIKTKRIPCFCYKCKRCETIVEKQGHFADGPESCKSDWSEWSPSSCTFFMGCESLPQRRTCVGQSTGGPPCPGSAERICSGPVRNPGRLENQVCP
ncbi:hypothetical protein CHS0354_036816 [Potamilus streckersoni]|uniref:MD-2-related lipid-recognition domain-containing protein n=1 Tax=Potamilus streckersoni TaxID=2493646 RepID=A0AAE0SJ45_9BIVA|nr:hypothetical protein CHS0354_036816 [Potamilus streckersoni]